MDAGSVTDVAGFTLLVAALLLIVAGIQPLAARLQVPPTVLLAAVGIGLGFAASVLTGPGTGALASVADPIAALPVGPSVFLYVFLPLLLFQACITIDVRRMIEDIAPILVLAVLAVVLTAAAIGLSLEALFGVPLAVALLLGAIVATTDPAAVVGIFRDIGAPARLTRLVEGESLLNDAAAIALFSLLLTALAAGAPLDALAGVERFVAAFAGGVLAGYAAGRALVFAAGLMRGARAAEVTLTLATAYLVYIVCDVYLAVSGIVAVVVTGLVVSGAMPARIAPDNWRHMRAVWEQIAFWASSLIFLLAALLVPRFLVGATLRDLAIVATVAVAAHLARAVVLFGVLPLLELAHVAQHVSPSYRLAILWGGLRGAVTLALALAVTENAALSVEVKRFVGIAASGYVLFTLFVNGLTLERVIRLLRLDRLSPVDLAVRNQILNLALADVADRVRGAARQYALEPKIAREVTGDYGARAAEALDETAPSLSQRERLTIGLVSLAAREKGLILEHHGQRTIEPGIVGTMLRHAERLIEQARWEGRSGYMRAAGRPLDFGARFHAAYFAHRYLHVDRFLRRSLAARFEMLLVLNLLLRELLGYVPRRLAPLLGARNAEILTTILRRRLGAVRKAIEALRLQYPGYAEILEREFLVQIGRQEELEHYEELRAEGLLEQEVHESLRRAVEQRGRLAPRGSRLDMKLDAETMIRSMPLFAHLDDAQVRDLARLMRPRFVLPGKRIIRRGESRRLSLYFVASGAVEVRQLGRIVRLGPGDFFGEMALLTGQPRSSDVVTLSFCHLLNLSPQNFRRFLDRHPGVRRVIEETAERRTRENAAYDAGAVAGSPGTAAGGGGRPAPGGSEAGEAAGAGSAPCLAPRHRP